jgi:hypothetical protein
MGGDQAKAISLGGDAQRTPRAGPLHGVPPLRARSGNQGMR